MANLFDHPEIEYMTNLSIRITEPEIMDDLNLPDSEIAPVLEGLGKVNAWFGGHQSIIRELEKLPLRNGCTIADWGCGGGDTLIAIAQWAEKKRLKLKLTGIDAAPAAIGFARKASAAFSNISYVQANVLTDVGHLPTCDVIISSLFTHHFDDEQWVQLVQNMAASARKNIIITDLHRHPVLYYALIVLTRLITRNPMARNDGPLSVRRAFKKADLVTLLKKVQIVNYNLTWHWPFRWHLVISKS